MTSAFPLCWPTQPAKWCSRLCLRAYRRHHPPGLARPSSPISPTETMLIPSVLRIFRIIVVFFCRISLWLSTSYAFTILHKIESNTYQCPIWVQSFTAKWHSVCPMQKKTNQWSKSNFEHILFRALILVFLCSALHMAFHHETWHVFKKYVYVHHQKPSEFLESFYYLFDFI